VSILLDTKKGVDIWLIYLGNGNEFLIGELGK